KKIHKTKRNIFHVLLAITHFQIFVNLFKKLDSIVKSIGRCIRYAKYYSKYISKHHGILTFEMMLINAPRVIHICSISMSLFGWNDKSLMLMQKKLLAVIVDPTTSLHAINQYILSRSLTALSIVISGIGIIPDVGHV